MPRARPPSSSRNNRPPRRSSIDARASACPSRETARPPFDDERHARVEQHRFPPRARARPRAGAPASPHSPRRRRPRAARARPAPAPARPASSRQGRVCRPSDLDPRGVRARNAARRGRCSEWKTIGPLGAERGQRLREQRHQLRPAHADQLPRGAGGIRERAEDVEDRPDAELPPHAAERLHRRVERRREQEHEADVVEHPPRERGLEVDPDPAGLEHVGRADARGDRAVPVLGHGGSRSGGHDRGGGRDVEEVAAEAARAAGVEQRRAPRCDAAASGAAAPSPRPRSPRPSRRASASPSRSRALLRLGGPAVHEIAERRLGERAAAAACRTRRCAAPRRRRASRAAPEEVARGSAPLPASAPTRDGTGRRTRASTGAPAP